jgi:hypothetical protein
MSAGTRVRVLELGYAGALVKVARIEQWLQPLAAP